MRAGDACLSLLWRERIKKIVDLRTYLDILQIDPQSLIGK
jgi:hypothetical protein